MNEITLRRSGNAPLKFTGELLAESEGQHTRGRDNNRWHDIGLYRTAGGSYVLAIAYRTCWQGELDRDLALVCDSPASVRETLVAYDPTEPVSARGAGYPLGNAYAERQSRLLADLRARWEEQVSELLIAAGDELAEVIE